MADQNDKGRLTGKLVALTATEDFPNLGDCEFAERIGQGRLSDVYKLVEHGPGKVIGAAKVRKPNLSDDMVRRFNEEANTLRRLQTEAARQNPQYVTYFPKPLYFNLQVDHHEAGKFALLVLEYVEAAEFLEQARQTYAQNRKKFEVICLEAARQYAEVLMVLHGAQLTSADRKVGDVRWRTDNTLVVLDWNVVQEGETVRPLDLQKFGQLWFQFLVGQAPYFAGKTDRQVVVLDYRDYSDRWRELSAGTQAILRKALHPIPHCRYGNAQQLREEIDAHLQRWKTPDLKSLIKNGRDESVSLRKRLALLDIVWRRKSNATPGDAEHQLDIPPNQQIEAEIGNLHKQIEQSRLNGPRELIRNRQYGDAIPLLEYAIAELPYASPDRVAATRLYLYAQALLDGSPEDPGLLGRIDSLRTTPVIGGVV